MMNLSSNDSARTEGRADQRIKVAYLVVAHNSPRTLQSAVERLSCEDSAFFIHIDQKSRIQDFSNIQRPNVFFSKERKCVYWGEFSMVEAILLLLKQALESAHNFDYFFLVSGGDHPVRSCRYIHEFLEENRGREFMSLIKMPAPGKPLSRIRTLRFPSTKPVRRFVWRALARIGLADRDYRKLLGNLEPYAGNSWWALTRDASEYVSSFAERNPRVLEYFQNVFAPDESFFQTIIGNSEFRDRTRRNLHYEDWSIQGPHPSMIADRHIALFEAEERVCVTDMYGSGEVLFARKFSDKDLVPLQRLEEMIERMDSRTFQKFSAPSFR
jgi:Core-2/I-Branching enzyme